MTSSPEWKAFRAFVLQRDGYSCRIRYVDVCTGYATVVDKQAPAARRPDLAFDERNARAACPACNDLKALTVDRGLPEPPRAA